MGFKDLFSGHSTDYARFRPSYPPELLAYITSHCAERGCAWDCATGNGQAAVALAEHFERVIATDASEKQLASAQDHPRVKYAVATAEKSGLADQSIDLITVAQAFHWFNHPIFYEEVRRVLKPGAPLAVWCYELCFIDPELDRLVLELYKAVLGEYWEKERLLVEDGYRSIPFPFREIAAPPFTMKTEWNLEQLVGYIGTWSALRKYIAKNGENPLESFAPRLKKAWGREGSRTVSWPLSLRMGRV